ncbi:MAG: hypothetical protein IAF58_05745 [Leptolyngbya sp.]|nr:hypothetical protein [Candidatus Melainabacteria bacterium]
MKESMFWMPGDENGPITDDAGSETLAEFWEWRNDYENTPVKEFLFEFFEVYGISGARVLAFSSADPNLCVGELHSDANTYDDLVLATAFGQFMKEGCIDSEIHRLALNSAQRQIAPIVLNFRCANPDERLIGLGKTIQALKKCA